MAHNVTGENSPSWPVQLDQYRHCVIVRRPVVGNRHPVAGIRGTIKGFSRQSRRRMLHSLAKANADPSFFITLTYGDVYPSMSEAKEDFRVWSQRFRRTLGRAGMKACLVWRVERQRRGSPHFHLLIWCSGSVRASLVDTLNAPSRRLAGTMLASRQSRIRSLSQVRGGSWWDWLLTSSALWSERLSGENRGSRAVLNRAVDCERIRGRGSVVSYVSKYLAKVPTPADTGHSETDGPHEGRVWGTHGERGLMDQRSLARLGAADSDALSADLAESFEAEGLEWAALRERSQVSRYLAYHPAEALWPLVDRWLRVFAGQRRLPFRNPMGNFPQLDRCRGPG